MGKAAQFHYEKGEKMFIELCELFLCRITTVGPKLLFPDVYSNIQDETHHNTLATR